MSVTHRIARAITIDDEKLDQMLYRRIMTRSGLVDEVIGFRMAQDALDYLRSPEAAPVDVIFLDINMPQMNGLEFLQQATRDLGEGFASSVVIMLTAPLEPELDRRVREFGIVRGFIDKPLNATDLAEVARDLESRQRVH